MPTVMPKKETITRSWHLIDAEGQILGRLAARVATLLMGKHKPTWAPHVDTGDHVVVVNAAKIELSGRKLLGKIYRTHSGYIGGLTETRADAMLRLHPERVIEWAVSGMLPKTKLGRAMAKKLKVYRGTEHPHQAQQPQVLSARKKES